MKDLGKIIAHVPAREGSKRVPSKNLRYLAGRPLLAYSVDAALKSDRLETVYVNTESDLLAALAESLGAKLFRRKKELAVDTVTSDLFNMNIIEELAPDTLVMINPVCPLLESGDIDDAIDAYCEDDVDTLITTNATRMQCLYQGRSVNFNLDEILAMSQDNEPVHICNWAVSIWDAHLFRERFMRLGYAAFGGKRRLYPLDQLRSFKISTEEDFRLVEQILFARKVEKSEQPSPRFWRGEG